ncbi:MAG: hypothetical protein RIG84_12315 [Roseovarius sp.]
MNEISRKLQELHDAILSADAEARRSLQPELAEMIADCEAKGAHVPAQIHELNEDLLADAMEAQFDNIPL